MVLLAADLSLSPRYTPPAGPFPRLTRTSSIRPAPTTLIGQLHLNVCQVRSCVTICYFFLLHAAFCPFQVAGGRGRQYVISQDNLTYLMYLSVYHSDRVSIIFMDFTHLTPLQPFTTMITSSTVFQLYSIFSASLNVLFSSIDDQLAYSKGEMNSYLNTPSQAAAAQSPYLQQSHYSLGSQLLHMAPGRPSVPTSWSGTPSSSHASLLQAQLALQSQPRQQTQLTSHGSGFSMQDQRVMSPNFSPGLQTSIAGLQTLPTDDLQTSIAAGFPNSYGSRNRVYDTSSAAPSPSGSTSETNRRKNTEKALK